MAGGEGGTSCGATNSPRVTVCGAMDGPGGPSVVTWSGGTSTWWTISNMTVGH